MPEPTRLPVQHPQAPHCTVCKSPLPNFNSLMVTMGSEAGDFEVIGMTIHIRCKCGTGWDLLKGSKHG
jgi:hypothetical protein